jgi:hypothetical protein
VEIAKAVALSLLALGYASAAQAITVDGVLDAAYGSSTSTVLYDATAPTGNFGAPTNKTDAIGYSIYLKNESGTLYGFLQASGPGAAVGSFANLYFGNNAHGGSTIGFEIANQNAFIPGVPGSSITVPIVYTAAGNNFEFAIPDSYFTTTLSGMNTTFPNPITTVSAGYAYGDTIQLRLSQSFGYSVAGGMDDYGPNRLGSFQLEAAAVPAPIVGAGLPGLLMAFGGLIAWRRRRNQPAVA